MLSPDKIPPTSSVNPDFIAFLNEHVVANENFLAAQKRAEAQAALPEQPIHASEHRMTRRDRIRAFILGWAALISATQTANSAAEPIAIAPVGVHESSAVAEDHRGEIPMDPYADISEGGRTRDETVEYTKKVVQSDHIKVAIPFVPAANVVTRAHNIVNTEKAPDDEEYSASNLSEEDLYDLTQPVQLKPVRERPDRRLAMKPNKRPLQPSGNKPMSRMLKTAVKVRRDAEANENRGTQL